MCWRFGARYRWVGSSAISRSRSSWWLASMWARHLPADQRPRLDRWLEPRRAVPDANHPARRPVCVRGTPDRTLGGRGYRRRPADGRQRLCLAASQDPVERRRRPRGLLRAARPAHLRLLALDLPREPVSCRLPPVRIPQCSGRRRLLPPDAVVKRLWF